MKAKGLESIIGDAMAISEAEMVQRFQKLRDMRQLPVSRGRNAEHIATDAIVSGLLSVVAERPGFAGTTVNFLRELRPVDGPERGFAHAETFAAALRAALNDEALLSSVSEIRVTDAEIYTNSYGRGVICYQAENTERKTWYLRDQGLTRQQPGTYDPRDLISSMIREVVIYPHVLKQIAREVREYEEYARLKERFSKEPAS